MVKVKGSVGGAMACVLLVGVLAVVSDPGRPAAADPPVPAVASPNQSDPYFDPSTAFFERYDADKDGRLAWFELDAAAEDLKATGGKFMGRYDPWLFTWLDAEGQAKALAAFRQWDTDGDGRISHAEHELAIAVWKTRWGKGENVFSLVPYDQARSTFADVIVSPLDQPILSYMTRHRAEPEAELRKRRQLIRKYDRDADGFLSADELRSLNAQEEK